MFRIIARTVFRSSRSFRTSRNQSSPLPSISGFLGSTSDSVRCDKSRIVDPGNSLTVKICDAGFRQNGEPPSVLTLVNSPLWEPSGVPRNSRNFDSVAEAVSSTDAYEDTSVIDENQRALELSTNEVIGDRGRNSGTLDGGQLNQQIQHTPRMIAGISAGKYAKLKRRQIKIETEVWEQAAKEYRELLTDMCEKKLAPNLPYVKSLFLGWFEPLRNQIVVEQELCKDTKSRLSHAPYFNQLPAEMMAVITMHKLMSLLMIGCGDGNVRVVHAACQVGEAIEQEARIHRFLEKTRKRKIKDKKDKELEGDIVTKEQEISRKKVTNLMKKRKIHQVRNIVRGLDDSKPWGQEARAKVGSRLINLLMETAYIQPLDSQPADGPPDIRPAFRHSLRITKELQKHCRRYGVIECDPLVRQGLDRTARHMVIPYMPMLVPPVNWTGYDKGAHLFLPSYIMRTHGVRQQKEAVKRAPQKQMQAVYEALDTLGSTKWRVNKRVLFVIDRIWSSGGRLADLVDCEDIPLPEKPDIEDETELRKWKWKMKSVKKENSERYSERCDVELKLAVARKMKDEDGFYYPHNLDFRGRAYPMHPYLNHLGSDLCRGILEFAEGRPLGKSGIHWLKIHLANLYAGGVDKLSYDGRLAFTENHLEDIFDSADRPLEGRRWWLRAEDPFQCLAVCINLSEALRSSSPETTISYTPIHQDGSCNGLQHYAALGRDKGTEEILYSGVNSYSCTPGGYSRHVEVEKKYMFKAFVEWNNKEIGDKRIYKPESENFLLQKETNLSQQLGAIAVNLVAGDKPADVYSGIATRVHEIMQRDAQKDPAEDQNALQARLLVDQVDRKLVKQTVMTSVYGVTYFGAREQIKRRLKERGFAVDDSELFSASCYAAKTTLTALGEMFESARSIMSWLGDCAKVIASENHPVRWTTPIGLPVVQPYRSLGRHLIKTSLQVLTLQRETDKVMVKRQRTAFPPNFVHSLDGSHMMTTAVACKKEGLRFAGVHDSYWTHASDVDQMNTILREKFVELYEIPILENLLESFQQSFPTLDFPRLPERGNFDLKNVLESQYFFN